MWDVIKKNFLVSIMLSYYDNEFWVINKGN